MEYFQQAGYGIDEPPPEPEVPSTGDARLYDKPILIGTPLRDAAVDPFPRRSPRND